MINADAYQIDANGNGYTTDYVQGNAFRVKGFNIYSRIKLLKQRMHMKNVAHKASGSQKRRNGLSLSLSLSLSGVLKSKPKKANTRAKDWIKTGTDA